MRIALAIALLWVGACTRVVDLAPLDATGPDGGLDDAAWLPDAGSSDDAAWDLDADIGFPDGGVPLPIDAGPLPDAEIDARF